MKLADLPHNVKQELFLKLVNLGWIYTDKQITHASYPQFINSQEKLCSYILALKLMNVNVDEEKIIDTYSEDILSLPHVEFIKSLDDQLRLGLELYANYYGLPFYNDDVTYSLIGHISEPRICGLPDVIAIQRDGRCLWPFKNLKVTFNNTVAKFSVEQIKQAFEEACKRWSDVCDLRFTVEFSTSVSNSNIHATFGVIDGRSNTLAWSELPCGSSRLLYQKYDSAENWEIYLNANANPSGNIDLVRVMCHELGHAIGIPHISNGNLMQPSYSPRIGKPQSGDIREAVARYGTPRSPAPPPQPPATPQPPTPPVPPSIPGIPDTLLKWIIDFIIKLIESKTGRETIVKLIMYIIGKILNKS